jgi:hypothetical protein
MERQFNEILSFHKLWKGILLPFCPSRNYGKTSHCHFVFPEIMERHFIAILSFQKLWRGILSPFCPSGNYGEAFHFEQ